MNTAMRKIRRVGSLVGFLAACLAFVAAPAFATQQIGFFDATATDAAGDPVTAAGSRPATATAAFLAELYDPPDFGDSIGTTAFPVEQIKDVVVELPPGFVGNPQAARSCSNAALAANGVGQNCPLESQAGYSVLAGFSSGFGKIFAAVWNMGAAAGTPAVLAINIAGVLTYASAEVRTGDDYGVTVAARNIPTATNLVGNTFVVWGKPQDPSHDTERGYAMLLPGVNTLTLCATPGVVCPSRPSSAPNVPFLSLPTSCTGTAPVTTLLMSSWEHPDEFALDAVAAHNNSLPFPTPTPVTACGSLEFRPTLQARPTTNAGDSATGLDVDLHTPQVQDPNGVSTPHLRDSVVTLPEGLVVNPASANGLGTCDLAGIGYTGAGNEEQSVDVSGIGPFSLIFDGRVTAQIPGDSAVAAVQSALEALPNIAPGDVVVSGNRGGAYTIEFTGAYAGQDVPLMRAIGLTNKIQQVAVDATAGNFTLRYGASTSANIDAARVGAAEVEYILENLPDVKTAGGSASVRGGPPNAGAGKPFYVEFDGGAFAGTNQSISATNVSLTGGAGTITVNDVQAAGAVQQGSVLTTREAGHHTFTPEAADCPDPARLASAEIDTPLLDHVINGSVYLAEPFANPFDRFIALYITANDVKTGIVIKLAGHVELDPASGRVQAVFDDNPQLPFEHLRLHFFGGPTAALRTPSVCGDHTTTSTLTPWSAPDSGPPAQTTDTWQITQNCAGSEAGKPHAPSFDAGAVSPIAAAHSPFVVKLRREDGEQNFKAVTVRPPAGLTAKLAGTPACPDAALAAAANKSGAAEKASPSCPAASDIGQVVAGAGAGPAPYYAHGRAYLAGPYKGAPISLATVIPATAGPFDVGTVVTRIAAHIDPKTAEITAISDDIPEILAGIPLDVRTVDVSLDKPDFSLNPTNCDPLAVGGLLTSTTGQVAPLSARFQLGECTSLGFKPKIALRLKGGTKRGKYPQLTAYLLPREGDANIRSVSVAFPRSEFLANEHISNVCTRADFAADACPQGSILGASTVYSPLLDYPLTGNVYLRTNGGANLLPDVVPDLRGPAYQPIRVEATGVTDSVNGGIRNTFELLPDAPFSRAILSLKGGAKGLLKNSRDICARTYRAKAIFTAHSGDRIVRRPKLVAKGCKGKRKRKKSRGHKRGGKRVALSARAGVR